MQSKITAFGAILLAIATALGALGAHALQSSLSTGQLASFKTGVLYLLVNAVAIMATSSYISKRWFRVIGTGMLVFSFSIFLLACKDILSFPASISKVLGPITPVGGILLIVGWLGFGIQLLKKT